VKLLTHYQAIGDLFEYPDLEYPQRVRKVMDLLDGNYPKAVAELEQFLELLPERELRTMQELFTRSFDVQAITTLDVGYVLFGDDYKRGELLANLNREHLEVKNDCRRELADHLPNIIRLVGKLKNGDLADELVEEIIAPAVSMMIGEFDPGRVEKKNESYKKHYKTLIEAPASQDSVTTLYQYALKALYEILKKDFTIKEKSTKKPTSDFLQSVVRENDIEEANACSSNNCTIGER
jgi:nitrate reductase assembly molybdenum cofactor insertion protein NarJ